MSFPITLFLPLAYTHSAARLTASTRRPDNSWDGGAALRAPGLLLTQGRQRENAVTQGPDSSAAWEVECIVRVLSGGRGAFDQLVDAYTARIYTHVFRMLRNREEAEDIVQETFLRAYRGLARFDRTRPFRNWLYAIATNLALNALRARQRCGQLVALDFDAEEIVEVIAKQDDARAIAGRSDLAGRLADAIASLPSQPAALVHLHYLEGMTIREAADAMNMSEDAAKVALHRARKRLRELMGEKE